MKKVYPIESSMAYSNVAFQNPYYPFLNALGGGSVPHTIPVYHGQVGYREQAAFQHLPAAFNPVGYTHPGVYLRTGECNQFGGNPSGYSVEPINPSAPSYPSGRMSDPSAFNATAENSSVKTNSRNSTGPNSNSTSCNVSSCRTSCGQTKNGNMQASADPCNIDARTSTDCTRPSCTPEKRNSSCKYPAEKSNAESQSLTSQKSTSCSSSARISNSCNCSRSSTVCRCSVQSNSPCVSKSGARSIPVNYVNSDNYSCCGRTLTANDLAVYNRTCDNYNYCLGSLRQNCTVCPMKSAPCSPVTSVSACGGTAVAGTISSWCPIANSARPGCPITNAARSICPVESGQGTCGNGYSSCGVPTVYYQYPCATATPAATSCGTCPIPAADGPVYQVMGPCSPYNPAAYNLNRYGQAGNYGKPFNAYICTPNATNALAYNPSAYAYAVPVRASAVSTNTTAAGAGSPCNGSGTDNLSADPDTQPDTTSVPTSEPKARTCVLM